MRPPISASRLGSLAVAALLFTSACARDALLPAGPAEVVHAKGGKTTSTAVAVSAVAPAYGEQGATNLKVRIVGSGFGEDAQATWERGGAPDPKVKTNATRYLSSTELEADITIAADADLAFYDVSVTLLGSGKKGVGMEMFEVTTAVSIGTLGGNTLSRGISDAGEVVGYSVVGNVMHAFFWEQGSVMRSLGTGDAHDIHPEGTVVVGASGGKPSAWIRGAGGEWGASEALPSSSGGTAYGTATDGAGLVIVGRSDEPLKRGQSLFRASVWRRSGVGWTRETLPLPTGVAANSHSAANDVNARGQIVGGTSGATLWEPLPGGGYTPTLLLPLPGQTGSGANAINGAGTLIVGHSGNLPAYWQLENGVWSAARPLEASPDGCTGAGEYANDVNDRGWIVGRTCRGTGWRATLWRAPGAPREDLGSLGNRNDDSAANAVSNAASPVIAGNSPGVATREAVIWPDLLFAP